MTNQNPPSDPIDQTLAYYNEHAEEFIERTADLPMEHLYEPFLAVIPPGGRILDAGCGSGRDAAEFAKRGYQVTAFDGAANLAKLASQRTGLSVLHLTFEEMNWKEEFDGVWACASLLHLPSDRIDGALHRLTDGLRRGGVLFVSMKAGEFEGRRDQRWFTDTTPTLLGELLTGAGLELLKVWETENAGAGLTTRWVSALAQRRTV
jgi:2-polyprenyl-3-methyl-5-hydroxy-6-metoxy-1,4-benzoquinol methylase